jgi:hypothetical protein
MLRSIISMKLFENENEQNNFYFTIINPFNLNLISLKKNIFSENFNVLNILIQINGFMKGINSSNVFVIRKFYESHFDLFLHLLIHFHSEYHIFLFLLKFFCFSVQRQIKICKLSQTDEFSHFSNFFSFLFQLFSTLKQISFGNFYFYYFFLFFFFHIKKKGS